MPWKEVTHMEERARFVILANDGTYTLTELCEQFGISRKTGYKWLARYAEGGVAALRDRSRSPRSSPHRSDESLERLVVKERSLHPTWGGKKIQTILRTKHGMESPPCVRTVDAILKRYNLVTPRRRRGGVYRIQRGVFTVPERPMQVVTVDFKGWFQTRDGAKFEPLTIADLYSHYLLRAISLPQSTIPWTQRVFHGLFRLEGVPEIIRVDNGSPFGSVGPGGLTKLSVWWISLGIEVQFSRPGCPQDNGSHERMHRTMKEECCTPPSANLRAQQLRMNRWRHGFNHERPHEELGQRFPVDLYQKSRRRLDEQIRIPLYEPSVRTFKVSEAGAVRIGGNVYHVGEAFAGRRVALEEEESGRVVRFANVKLGLLPKKAGERLIPYPYAERWEE
jgi:transposase InsO family protein